MLCKVTVLASLLSFVLLAYMLSTDFYLASIQGTSISFRFSYTTLPLLLILPFTYEKLTRKHLIVLLMIFSLVIVIFHPYFFYVVQSNQSLEYVNRISLTYVAPYRRLYNYLKSENSRYIAVFADPQVRVSLYVWMTDAVLYRITINESRFQKILKMNYQKILFYGEKWYGYWQTMEEWSPFYYSLIRNQTSYKLEIVWDDNESHLFLLRCKL